MKPNLPSKGKKLEISSEEIKALLLNVGSQHFAKFGLQGVSLKRIAQEAGVANSLINYHFKDKEGLFKACVERFARTQLQFVNRVLREARSREELRLRLEMFVEEMILSVMADPCGFEMLDHEVQFGNPVVLEVFQTTLLHVFKGVVHFFESAQKSGLIKPELDPFILAGVLFMSTCDALRKDHLGKVFFGKSFEQPEHRKNYTMNIVTIFITGVLA